MSPSLTWNSVLQRPRDLPPLLMAHRGSSNELPENTLAAFERALGQGAEVLETDIRFTRDDEIVLMHDPTLDRTTNGKGIVAQMTLVEMKRFRAERSFESKSKLGDEEIPTLADFLEFTNGRERSPQRSPEWEMERISDAPNTERNGVRSLRSAQIPIALELKDDRFIKPADAERLIEVLARHNALERTVLLSFNRARLDSCKRVAPQIPIGVITLKNPFPLYDTELMGPFFPLLYLNPLYFAWARRRGKIACPLDPEPEPRLRYYRWLGAPVLLTNHPAVTRRALEQL